MNQNDLFLNPVSSKMFSWSGKTNSFCAEISNLGPGFSVQNRLFADAADCGFTMVSERTGRMVRFILDGEIKRDGDIALWQFTAYERDLIAAGFYKGRTQRNPELFKRPTVVLFND